MSGSSRRGLTAIILATAVAGVAGYLVTWIVFRAIGAADYAVFAIFWSATYLLVGALSGVQQEVTRATRRREPDDPPVRPVARNFALIVALITVVVVVAATPLWVLVVFPHGGAGFVAPLAIGAAAYVVVAVTGGTLYGLSLWNPVALMVVLDGLLRLIGIGVVLLTTHDPVALAWAVALPFPISVIVVWFLVRSRVVGRNRLDVGPTALTWNVTRTIAAAASTGALVSGFPVILKITSPGEDPQLLGLVILAVTLVRAPLIVTVMSLQSYLIVQLRPEAGFARRVGILAGLIIAGGAVISVLGWWLGPALFLLLFGHQAAVAGWLIAVLVGSSAAVALLFVTGPALLARGGHLAYTLGWLLAAAATVVALLVPLPFMSRVVLALIVGPVVGLVVHAVGLFSIANPRRRASDAAPE